MGCSDSRPLSVSQKIDQLEKRLQFHKLDVNDIKQGFFKAHDRLTRNQIDRFIEGTKKLKYSEEDLLMVHEFFDAYLLPDEKDVYDSALVLTTLFIMTNSPKKEKAAALFDLYDDEDQGNLSVEQVIEVITRITEGIFTYCEAVADTNEAEWQEHWERMHQQMSKFRKKFMPTLIGEGPHIHLSRKDFQWRFENICNMPDLLDLSNPKMIRTMLMDYLDKLPSAQNVDPNTTGKDPQFKELRPHVRSPSMSMTTNKLMINLNNSSYGVLVSERDSELQGQINSPETDHGDVSNSVNYEYAGDMASGLANSPKDQKIPNSPTSRNPFDTGGI